MTLTDEEIEALARGIEVDDKDIEQRKAFLGFGRADIERLTELHELIETNDACAFFVDRFYGHLFGHRETARLIPDEQILDRLKQTQTRYFHSLLAGDYGRDYVRHRLRVGAAHEKVGLEPKWYLGAYCKYLDLLIPKCLELHSGDAERTLHVLRSILKIMFLDMGLAIDTYIHAKDKSILSKAAQLEGLNQVALAVTASLSLDEVMDRILRQGMELSGSEAAVLAIYDETTQTFSRTLVRGLPDAVGHDKEVPEHEVLMKSLMKRGPVHGMRIDEPASDTGEDESPARGLRPFVCLPMMARGVRLGVICLYRPAGRSFDAGECELLTTFSRLAGQAIDNAINYTHVADEASTDELTGLPNRRAFERRLVEEKERLQRSHGNLALLMVDIDRFKQVNDTYGHMTGDAVLTHVAHCLENRRRSIDFVARYGGEEFVILLPGTDAGGGMEFARRLRREITSSPWELPDGKRIGISISVGVAECRHSAGGGGKLVEMADQALYAAKRAGRNREMCYSQTRLARMENEPEQIITTLTEGLENIGEVLRALGNKAPYLTEHFEGVERIALAIAGAMDLDAGQTEKLGLAALLHDVGMVYVPSEILNKQAVFTEEDEWRAVREHAPRGAKLLERIPQLGELAPIVRYHHERYDGSGYPEHLKGEDIPLLARVLAAADVYVAMTSDQPYRKALSREAAIAFMRSEAGGQFDPAVIKALLSVVYEHVAE